MLKALAWKEWREQRPVVYTGVILAAILPILLAASMPMRGPRWEAIDLVRMIPVALGIFVWPILAAAAGASTVSAEAGAGTLGFLLSRPISRKRLWLIKVSVAILSVVTAAAISLALAQLCNLWLSRGQPGTSLSVFLRGAAFGPFDLFAMVSLSLLMFACATLFSTIISRPLPAAAAGGVLALLVLAGILMLWAAFSLIPRLEPQWLAAEVSLAALLILLTSFAVFARAELLRPRSGRPAGTVAAVLVLGLFGLVAIPAVHALDRLGPTDVVIDSERIAVSDGGVAMVVTRLAGVGEEMWMVRADGSGTIPLAGRHASSPTFAPRGREIFYFSRRGMGGGELGAYDLRAVTQEGASDRLIAAGLASPGKLHFSPYARRALLALESTLYVIALHGNEITQLDIGAPELAGAVLAGWIDNAKDDVLFVRLEPTDRPGFEEMALLAFNLGSGETRTLYEATVAPVGYELPDQPSYGWHVFPVPAAPDEASISAERGMRIDLVALESGEVTSLGASTCFSGELSSDSSVLMYVRCLEQPTGGPTATVSMRNLDTDEEKSIAEINLAAERIRMVVARRIDWDDDSAWIVLAQEPLSGGETIAVVLGPEGHRLSIMPGWVPVGLSGSSRVLLVDNLERIRTMASGDIRTGMLQVIYP